MEESYAKRHLNAGLSGWERKKSEIFQMLVLDPKLAAYSSMCRKWRLYHFMQGLTGRCLGCSKKNSTS